VRSKYGEEIIRLQKTTLYPSIDLELTVLDAEKKSGYGMLSEYSSTTKNFVHKEMWID